jgi:hypothetical protein
MSHQGARTWAWQASRFSQVAHRRRAAHAALWWTVLAVLLCIALLLALQAVLQRAVDQGALRRSIKLTQLSAARNCMALAGGRVQELCLLALNESARQRAESMPPKPAAQAAMPSLNPRSSP